MIASSVLSALRLLRPYLVRLGWACLLLVLALPVLVWGLAHNDAVTKALLPHVPGIRVWGAQGALLGDFKARRVEIDLPRGSLISLDDAAWQNLSIHVDPRAEWLFGLHAKGLTARLVQIKWVPNPHPAPTTDPHDLRLPLSVSIDRVQAARGDSVLWGDLPLMDLDGRLVLGQQTHQVDLAGVRYGHWHLKGKGQVETLGKLQGQLQIQANGEHDGQGDARLPLSAALQAKGPLTHLALTSQVQAGEGSRTQSLDVAAVLALWAPWPLPDVHLKAHQFDLSALAAALPETRLSGQADWSSLKQDLNANVNLVNDRPGAWSSQRLPIKQLKGHVNLPGAAMGGDMQTMTQAGVLQLKGVLPSLGGGSDGQLSLDGSWDRRSGQQAKLGTLVKLGLKDVQLQALDVRAPALTLSGDVSAKPDRPLQQAKDLEQAVWDIDSDLTGAYQFAQGSKASASASLKTVEAVLRAQWQQGQVNLQTLTLQADGALASLKGKARYGGGTWQTNGALQVKGFDPRVWLPWPDALKGANRLQGQLDFDVASDWHGQAALLLDPSVLAGTDVAAHATWSAPKGEGRANVDVDVSAVGNHLRGQGQMPWRLGADGLPRVKGDQHWVVDLNAPALRALQTLASAWDVRGLGGAVTGQAHFTGQWPDVVTDGQVQVQQLRWQFDGQTASELESAKATWALTTTTWNSPLQWQATVNGLKLPHVLLDQANWTVTGTGRDHQSVLHVLGKPVRQAKGASTPKPIDPMTVDLSVHGSLQSSGGVAGAGSTVAGWQGRVGQLVWRSAVDGRREWLSAQPFDLQWRRQGDQDHVSTAGVDLSVMGAAMTLKELDWLSAPEQGGQGQLKAWLTMAPLNLSNMLKTWQPQGGWGGDLIVGGQVRVTHSQVEPWQVMAQVAKVSGDLSMSEPGIEGSTVQRLGVDKASVDLIARDGVWTLTEQFEGSVMGRLTGKQVVRTDSVHDLPDAADALSGNFDIQIASLRPWAVWVPAGWRLSGELKGQAELGGTLGAPQYRGVLNGRNLGLGHGLLGVNLTDGQLQLDMQGDHAHLTNLTAKGGAQGGVIHATGEAILGESPQAKLSVQADKFALFQRLDRRIVVSGQADALLTAADVKVDGKIKVDEGLFDFSRSDAPTVGEDVNVVNGPGKSVQDEDADTNGATTKRKMVASVDLDLGEHLHLKGRGLDTNLTGNLKFTTPNNRPSLQGTVRATHGTYAAYGQKLDIERGAISFTGPVENPRLDILAMRRQSPMAASSDVKVGVQITGTAQDPRVSLYSDPSMSETDKLSWLVLGRGPSGLGGADIGLLQSAAAALLSGEGPSTTDNIMSAVGLDDLSVRQSDGTVRDTVVNVGKQLSKFWYLGYERNLNATNGNWQLIYRLAQRFTLRAQTGADNAVDLIWAWRWD